MDRAIHHGFTVRTPLDPEVRAGHVSIDVPDDYEVCQALLAEDIICDYRPHAGIRLSPHFYTKEEECTAAVDRIAGILAEGAHERFKGVAHKPG